MNTPLIGIGQVRHTRLRPVRHAFAYPTWFLLLPMRSMRGEGGGGLARNRFALLSFHDKDHGDGRADSLEWLLELLRGARVDGADGEIWLHCTPRVLGYAFKPVSFWYCHRADGSLRAIVAEVHNTFGERHCYLLDSPGWGQEIAADKRFHVSPFCSVEGRYRFRFLMSPARDRTTIRIDHDDAGGPLLQTSVSGDLQPATRTALRAAFWRHPWFAFAVVARIHWQAFRLWGRGVPWFRKPQAPAQATTLQSTRQSPHQSMH